MLSRLLLDDAEVAELDLLDLLAVEYVVHERLAETARTHRSGDVALLFAIRAAAFLDPLVAALGEEGADRFVTAARGTAAARKAVSRAAELFQLAGRAA